MCAGAIVATINRAVNIVIAINGGIGANTVVAYIFSAGIIVFTARVFQAFRSFDSAFSGSRVAAG